jgi:hypothetical protein
MSAFQRLMLALVLLPVGSPVEPAHAYLKLGVRTGDRIVTLRWRQAPVRYRVTERDAAGISAADLRDAVGRAFATWQAVSSSSIAYQFGGFTSGLPGEDDGASTLGLVARPDLDRVLASTSFLVDVVTGDLLEADIFFNAAFPWSVAPGGGPGRYDVETIALHEIGHLSGLGHSAIGETELTETGRRVVAVESVMFPIAFGPGSVANRNLRADDIAGISDLYPAQGFVANTGSVSGRVVGAGRGLFGAHVVAVNLATGGLVGGFTLDANGQFSIAGLSPGPHLIRVEPLDDVEPGSFFEDTAPVALEFRPAFHRRLIVAPRGGDSGSFEVAVAPK